MDIRKYFSKKRPREDESQDDDTDVDVLPTHSEGCSTNVTEGCSTNLTEGCSTNPTAKALKKKVYTSKLTYRCQWESKYPWVYCEDPEKGKFFQICKSLENRWLLLAEHGHLVVYLIGTMARKSFRHIMIPSRIKMLL